MQGYSQTSDGQPAGDGQRSLWTFYRLAPDSPAYNMAYAAELRSDIDLSKFREAFSHIVLGQESLFCGYAEDERGLRMFAPDAVIPDMTVSKVSGWSDEQVLAWLESEADRPFALERGQVCRLRFLVDHGGGDRRVFLCIGIHHIAGDFLSFELFGESLFAAYEALARGDTLTAGQPGLYWQWLEKQRRILASPHGLKLERFWRDQMKDAPPSLLLANDIDEAAPRNFRGEELTFQLDAARTGRLKALSQELGVSLFGLLGAAFQVFLHRYSGQDQFLIGTPVSGRSGAEFEQLIGYTLNAIPWRVDLRGNPSFSAFAKASFRGLRAGLRRQRFPLSRISALASEKEGRGLLFRHMTTLVPRHERPSVARQVVQEFFGTQRGAANEINLRWQDAGDHLIAQWRYDSDLFRRDAAEQMVAGLQVLLDAILDAPHARLSALEVGLPAHLSEISASYPLEGEAAKTPGLTALQAFERQVRATPDRLAIIDGNQNWSYAALDARATHLAGLVRGRGYQADAPLAMLLPRSAEIAVTMLAAWKAGGAYLCLDPGAPANRLVQMLENSGARFLVGSGARPDLPEGVTWLDVTQVEAESDAAVATAPLPSPPAEASLPAYLIYTSGSTGQPKAVEVSQGNLLSYANAVSEVLQLPGEASLCALASVATDLGYTAWFGALLTGRTLHIVSDETAADPEALAQHFAERPVDCLKIVPSHLRALMAVAKPERLLPRRSLVLGGEALDDALVRQVSELAPSCRVINHYGPTETTVGCLTHTLAAGQEATAGRLPIGKPLNGCRAVVLDSYFAAAPIGVAGELAIGGAGVANGYLKQAGLTADRFVPDPYAADGSRLYRTGDRARMQADGRITFLGRVDDQVKIRGFRVEPGEIEAWLRQRPELSDAVVVARPAPHGQGLRLLAYVVPAETFDAADIRDGNFSGLRDEVIRNFQEAMVPSLFVALAQLPRLPNGKVDRQALPEPLESADGEDSGAVESTSETEETLMRLWAEALGRPSVSPHDNFFDLGGDSIIGLKIVAQARKAGLQLHPKQIFECRTIAALAQALDGASSGQPLAGPQETPLEKALIEIWKEVLKRDAVDRSADFFELGGDSILALQATAKGQAQGVRVTPKAIFEHRTIAALAAALTSELSSSSQVPKQPAEKAEDQLPDEESVALEPFASSGMTASELEAFLADNDDLDDIYPLSPLQQGLLFHSLLDAESGSYVNQLVVEASGVFEPRRFAEAWQSAIDSHPILRTTFQWEGFEAPLQCVRRSAPLPVSMLDWRDLDEDGRLAALQAFCANDRMVGFSLTRPPLMRLAVARVGADSWWLIWSRHHLIVDGWCSAMLLDEVLERYKAAVSGETPQLPKRPAYRSYIDWLSGQDQSRSEAFWQGQLRDFEAPVTLPFLREAKPGAIEPIKQRLVFDEDMTGRLREAAQERKITLNTLLQAAWGLVLSGVSGREDVVFGVTSAGRPPEMIGAEQILGVFINTLPLRVRPAAMLSLDDYLAGVQSDNLALREFEYASLSDIQSQSGVGTALFDTIMVFQNLAMIGERRRDLEGLSFRQLENIEQTHYGVTLEVMPEAAMIIEFTADRRRISEQNLARLAGFLETALKGLADTGKARVGDVDLLGGGEQQAIREWGWQPADYDLSSDWVERVATQVQRHPHRVVARCGDNTLSYRDLWQNSGELACGLRAKGIGPDSMVALLFPRGLELFTMMVAVLRAGGAWLPLDPAHPPVRWSQVLEQAADPLVVCDMAMRARLAETGRAEVVTCADLLELRKQADLPELRAEGDQLAYVIFTSGSTGAPKGAMVTRDGMLNNMLAKVTPLGLSEGDVIAQTASTSFDISVWQTLTAPLVGGCVEIIPDEVVRDPEALLELLQTCRISLFEPVPSLLQALLDAQGSDIRPLPALRWVLPTGEALPPACARSWFGAYPDIPLMNAYGPAECADDVAFHPLHAVPEAGESVPIGRPTANAELYILDAKRDLTPIGVVGEIAVGGVGVGRGYLADPKRTAASFVPNPWGAPGSRLYLTGDLGRWREEGTIEFAGRSDFQVKLRGYRIELGEIEAVLEDQSCVKRALVTVRAVGDAEQLVAYWQSHSDSQAEQEKRLADALSARLPSYMLPQFWVRVEHWPLNANGKVDLRALPEPQLCPGNAAAPESETERYLASLWQELLPGVQLGLDSDFFASGGHSLLAMKLLARLRRDGHSNLSMRSVFDAPTIRAFAQVLEQAKGSTAQNEPPLVPVERTELMPLSLAQQRLWLVERLSAAGTAAYNMTATLRLRGTLKVAALQQSLEALIERHEVLRTGYPEVDGEPCAVVMTNTALEIAVTDLSPLSRDARAAAIADLEQVNARTTFDISQAPLLRARLLKLDAEEHLLLFAMHHLVADGWSVGIMIDELAALYRDAVNRHADSRHSLASVLPDLPLQYSDYAVWQRKLLSGARLDSELDYWRGQLEGAPPVVDLPFDRPRSETASHLGDVVRFEVPAELLRRAEDFAQSQGATSFMVLLAAFQMLLHRLTGEQDLVVGTDTAGRDRNELEGLIGFFVNVLPLRSRIETDTLFADLVKLTRQTTLDAFEHDALPFDRIVEAVGTPRDRRFNPLVQSLFVLQNVPGGQFDLPGLEVELLPQRDRYSKFDMALFLEPRGGMLAGEWVFATALFEAATIQGFAESWLALLTEALDAPQTPVSQFVLPSRQEAVPMDQKVRMSAKLAKLKKVTQRVNRPVASKPVPSSLPYNSVRTSFLQPQASFPIILEPSVADLDPVGWARENRALVETLLCRHAGILFRNFSILTPLDFESFAEAMQPGLFGSYGDLPKKEGGKNIYRSTPYPERQMILYHNESSHLERWPRKQWFFCELAAPVGGATPIVDCREMLKRLPAELVEEFERKQLKYIRTFTKRLDVGWRDFFKTDDKSEVEARCRAGGIEYHWLDDETLQTRTLCPAVIRHPVTLERSFFNQVQLHHIACLEAEVRSDLLDMVGLDRMPRQVVFGDDSPIPDATMATIGEAYEACAVRFSWQPGDVVMLDNMLAAHARDPFEGPRKIAVAMGDMVERSDILAGGQVAVLEPMLQE